MEDMLLKKLKIIYISNSEVCRRKPLFSYFLAYCEDDTKVKRCNCCDVCSKLCNYSDRKN